LEVKILLDQHMIDHGSQPDLAEKVKSLGFETLVATYDPSRIAPKVPVFNANDCAIVYGSIAFIRQYLTGRDFHPGAYYSSTLFRCSGYMPKIESQLLANPEYIMIPFGELERRSEQFFDFFKTDSLFVRPDTGGKVFAGRVIGKAESAFDLDTINRLSGVWPDTMVLVAKGKVITAEYRFFIVAGEVITGSMYMSNGEPCVSPIVNADCMAVARKVAASSFQIDNAYCCDVGIVDGEAKVIELNSFSAAGLYACDAKKLFAAVAAEAMRDYLETHGS
jgi:hypothetical protein